MKTSLIIAVVALAPAFAIGAELRFQCPERYPSRLIELSEFPQGWQGGVAIAQGELKVAGGGVVGGPPTLYPRAELHGDTVKTRGGWTETRYPVGPDGESWAYCGYGHGGEIQLYRRVDGQGRRTCSVRLQRPKPPASLRVEIVCS